MIFFILNIWSLNRVSFTSASLTVGKNSTIITLNARVSYWFCYLIEYGWLLNVFCTHEVKIELLNIQPSIQMHSAIFDLNAPFAACFEFSVVEGSNSDNHFDVVVSGIEDIVRRISQKVGLEQGPVVGSFCLLSLLGVVVNARKIATFIQLFWPL